MKRIGISVLLAVSVGTAFCLDAPVRLSGTGDDETSKESGAFAVEPNTPYVFSCSIGKTSGGNGGVAVMVPCGVSMYHKPSGNGWFAFTNALFTADGKNSAVCKFRQWHVRGDVEFRDARLVKAEPRYAKAGGMEIGFGESVDGNDYRFSTRFDMDCHIHSRPILSYSGFSAGSVPNFGKKSSMEFLHDLSGRTMLSAKLGVALDGGTDGRVTLAVSSDGKAWTDLACVSNMGVHYAEVPAAMLPAKRLFARVKGCPGAQAKLRQYMFDARFGGPRAFGFGSTAYFDAKTGRKLFEVKPWAYLNDTESGALISPHPKGIACWSQSSGRKVFRGRPLPTDKARAIKVSAACNEAEAVQLVVRPERDLKGVKVSAAVECGDVDIEVRRVGYVLADLPMDNMGARGLWPDPIFPQTASGADLRAFENQPFWITAKPRKGAKPGLRKGSVKFICKSGAEPFSVPLEVRVFGFEMPDRMTCKTSFGLSFTTVFKYHRARTENEKVAVAEKYLEMFSRHHITPYTPTIGTASGPWTDKWSKPADRADSAPSFSWDAWDAAVDRALNRYSFNTFKFSVRGKGGGDSVTRKNRKPRHINGVKEGNPLFEKYMERYLKGIESHLREKGWLDYGYVYSFDEPVSADYGYVKEDLERLRRYAPGLRRMVTVEPREEFYGYVNLWCPLTEFYDRGKAWARQVAGDEIWWYVTYASRSPKVNEHVEHSGVDMRVWLWQTWLENVSGVLIWETAYWNSASVYPHPDRLQNPYEDLTCWTRRKPWNSGEGRYVYPPMACFGAKDAVLEEPVDSIRFEMLREGIEDYEYFAILKRIDPSNPLLAVPKDVALSLDEYSTGPEGMERHRIRLAREIETRLMMGKPL